MVESKGLTEKEMVERKVIPIDAFGVMRIVYPCNRCGHIAAWANEPTTEKDILESFDSQDSLELLRSWRGWSSLGGESWCTACKCSCITHARIRIGGVLSVDDGVPA